jgi:rubrerythrin
MPNRVNCVGDCNMMNKDTIRTILDAASELEILMADIYTIFAESLPEDMKFWEQMAHEEKNHAALIRSVESSKDMSAEFLASFPRDILEENIKTKEWATDVYIRFSRNRPDRKTAFRTAIEIETSAGEVHYQNIMSKNVDSWFIRVFQELNEFDRDHLKRINSYAREHKILGKQG